MEQPPPDVPPADAAGLIAEEVEQELFDGISDIFMLVRLAEDSPVWTVTHEEYPGREPAVVSVIGAGHRRLGCWTREEWRARMIAIDGAAFSRLSQSWIVSSFTRWEHDYRPRIRGLVGEAPRVDLFGDLGLLRNDVVHHRGVATSRNAGRCRLLKWFEPGDVILLTHDRAGEFLDLLETWVATMGGHPSRFINDRRDARIAFSEERYGKGSTSPDS